MVQWQEESDAAEMGRNYRKNPDIKQKEIERKMLAYKWMMPKKKQDLFLYKVHFMINEKEILSIFAFK